MKLTCFLQRHTAPIRFILFLSSFVVMGFVLADGHHYTYPSDTPRISKQQTAEITPSQKAQPQRTYRNSMDSANIQYRYAAPIQKPGSNPLTNPDRSPSVSYPGEYAHNQPYTHEPDTYTDITNPSQNLHSVNYTYAPLTQKFGSNPFNKNYSQFSQSRYKVSYPPENEPAVADNHSVNHAYDTEAYDRNTHNENGVIYIYAPLTKQLGSNPFNKSSHQYADVPYGTSKKQISSSDQEQYRYLYYYQPKPRYIESDNSFMSYADTP